MPITEVAKIKIYLSLLAATRKFSWLWLFGLIGWFTGNTRFYLFFLFALLIFVDLGFYLTLLQIFGSFYARIVNRFKLTSKENYTCKGNYILPFTGKWNVYNGGVTKELSHSWGIVSQRYAYDFIIFDDDGDVFSGGDYKRKNATLVEKYHCYARDIIAAADGVVVKVSNGHPDSRTNGQMAYCNTWDLRGNFVVIQHKDCEYSLSSHLMPDSITVKAGDMVKQGDVIAKCGNSGNSSEPHLHFQLQTSKNFFFAVGLPIEFTNIKAQDSVGYRLWHEKMGIKPRTADGNLEIINGKYYIGRGLDVENI